MNSNQADRFGQLDYFKTESYHEAVQLEQALLKVIPKIP